MKTIEGLQTLLILAVIAIIGYVGYELYQLFGTGSSSDYCNNNSNIFTSLFCGGAGTGGTPTTQCAGLGCTESLITQTWCDTFPSTCEETSDNEQQDTDQMIITGMQF